MMTLRRWTPTLLMALALGLATSMVVVDHAEARRGGGFGSRGSRTYRAPPATPVAPNTQQIHRSTTPQPSTAARQATPARQGFFGGGFAGNMMRGLLLGGVLGLLLGHGLGGLAGLFGLLLQIGLIALVIMFAMRLFRSARQPAAAGPGGGYSGANYAPHGAPLGGAGRPFGVGGIGPRPAAAPVRHDGVGIAQQDLDTFERLLKEIQTAFGREDHAALSQRVTPEVMAYFAQELQQNFHRGLRNEVSDVKLLNGDLAEAWREGHFDYATVAMRYESRDVMRERASHRIVSGDPDRPTATTEVWTFVRPRGGHWALSAVQDA